MKLNIFNPGLPLTIAIGAVVLIAALPLAAAPPSGGGGGSRGGGGGGGGFAPRSTPVTVDRVDHGSLRHADTQVVARPIAVQPRPVEQPREQPRPVEDHRVTEAPRADDHHEVARRPEPGPARFGFDGRPSMIVHRDVEADWARPNFWHGFAFHARVHALPVGCFSLVVGGFPYYYYDGVYYQQADNDYQEVYPPVGAAVPELPDGAIEIDMGDQAYFYAGGAFYIQQDDSGYVLVAPPMGIMVPELPPGATQVSVDGGLAYQFNGIFYRPVFADGVTQFVVFTP
jgi:hypothetical protein